MDGNGITNLASDLSEKLIEVLDVAPQEKGATLQRGCQRSGEQGVRPPRHSRMALRAVVLRQTFEYPGSIRMLFGDVLSIRESTHSALAVHQCQSAFPMKGAV